MNYRFVLVNATGGKKEREKLNFQGDSAGRALVLVHDALEQYGDVDGLLIVGMSNHQMSVVDQHMAANGYYKIIHKDYAKQKEAWRNTCITVAYVKRSLNPQAIVYDTDKEHMKYRYAAFVLPDGLEARAIHVPTAESFGKNATFNRKEAMLLFEESLEMDAKGPVVVLGDFNCSPEGTEEFHEIFDRLPYEKLLKDGSTWQDELLDNVLISPGLKAKAYTGDYHVGITSDHKAVICEVEYENE